MGTLEKDLHAVILAAGKGTRMRSDIAKVLHELKGTPLLGHVINTSLKLGVKSIEVVIGYQGEAVQAYVESAYPELTANGTIQFTVQEQQLGTGHAVQVTEPNMAGKNGTIIVLLGDVPLIKKDCLVKGAELLENESAAAVVLSMELDNPTGYGRIIRDASSELQSIREEKDANQREKEINEVNSGVFCFNSNGLFQLLAELKSENSQNEFYLTDCIEIMRSKGLKTLAQCSDPAWQFQGVNSPEQLTSLEAYLD